MRKVIGRPKISFPLKKTILSTKIFLSVRSTFDSQSETLRNLTENNLKNFSDDSTLLLKNAVLKTAEKKSVNI